MLFFFYSLSLFCQDIVDSVVHSPRVLSFSFQVPPVGGPTLRKNIETRVVASSAPTISSLELSANLVFIKLLSGGL